MKEIYVDGACRHREGIGAWAVVAGDNYYSGILKRNGLDSVYCELFAIRQALIITRKYLEKTIIFTDNNAVKNLHKSRVDFQRVLQRKSKRRKIKNKSILSNVYRIYKSSPNVEIKQISRQDNFEADGLVKQVLRAYNK